MLAAKTPSVMLCLFEALRCRVTELSGIVVLRSRGRVEDNQHGKSGTYGNCLPCWQGATDLLPSDRRAHKRNAGASCYIDKVISHALFCQ